MNVVQVCMKANRL